MSLFTSLIEKIAVPYAVMSLILGKQRSLWRDDSADMSIWSRDGHLNLATTPLLRLMYFILNINELNYSFNIN